MERSLGSSLSKVVTPTGLCHEALPPCSHSLSGYGCVKRSACVASLADSFAGSHGRWYFSETQTSNRLARSLARAPNSWLGEHELDSSVWTKSSHWWWKDPWSQVFLQRWPRQDYAMKPCRHVHSLSGYGCVKRAACVASMADSFAGSHGRWYFSETQTSNRLASFLVWVPNSWWGQHNFSCVWTDSGS